MANGNIITAKFKPKAISARVRGLWQWDYGQILKVIGIKGLPAATEVHFEQNELNFIVIGAVVDDVCIVNIPNKMLQCSDEIVAYIYLHDAEHGDGATEYAIYLPVNPRGKPEEYDEDDPEIAESYNALVQATSLLRSDISTVNDYMERAREYAEAAAEAVEMAGDYNNLDNKPQINGVTLQGNVSANELNLPAIYYDTAENWQAQTQLVSENKAIYVYTDYDQIDGQDVPGFKVGDGNAFLIDLPFTDMPLRYHMDNTSVHVNPEEKEKINKSVVATVSGEALIFI